MKFQEFAKTLPFHRNEYPYFATITESEYNSIVELVKKDCINAVKECVSDKPTIEEIESEINKLKG